MRNINKKFFNRKEIPIDKFFSNVLYNKKYGYYSKNVAFGKSGDFITSPDISFLFGEVIAIWVISYWEYLKKPKKINLIELGPGNGQLSKVMIRTFKKFPKFFKCLNIFLYEKSQKLIKIQKKLLVKENIKWIRNFNKNKKGPVIFFGNEFLDSLPVKQFEIKNNKIYERYIKLNKNIKIEYLLKKANKRIIEKLKKLHLLNKQTFIEYPKQGLDELNRIVKIVKKNNGGLLLIDYGFLEQKSMSTIQSVKKHKKNKLYDNLGNADITSLVNFALLKKYFKKEKLLSSKIVTQAEFLKRLGIIDRANIISQNMSFKEKTILYYNLQRLLDSKYMGSLFKVIFAFKDKKKFSLGFS